MKNWGKIIFAFCFLLFAFQKKAYAQAVIVIDHNNYADSLSLEQLDFVRNQVIFFTHKSIGNRILDGMRDLQSQNPSRYSIPILYGSGTNKGINEYQAGSNGSPLSKINGFSSLVKDGHNIAMMKFCTSDAPCINGDTEIGTIWSNYRDLMVDEQNNHPDTTFVWWTWPIIASNNSRASCNETLAWFNDQVRNYVNANGGVLFDIADIESHDPNGSLVSYNGFQAAWPNYTSDGAHPCTSADVASGACSSAQGSQRLASALWVLLYQAGINNPQASPSPSAEPFVYDIAPLGGDGVVNINDLLLVLQNWGWRGDPGSNRTDINKDGRTDFTDLLLILQHWG